MAQTVILECTTEKKLNKNPSDCSSAMMRKKQKFSKGYSSGFAPDYRHAVETVGESEGFGSSGSADPEDSCTRKRKCINLNVDCRNGFNVPLQVISASKMSRLERKDLQKRLRVELEKVQIFQKKTLCSMPAVVNGVALSSSSDGDVRKQGLKRGISGRFESTKWAPPSLPSGNSDVMVMKQCETLLKNLMAQKYSWVFNTPVDVVKLKIPDYFTVIKHPMDLGTIKKKLALGSYPSPWGFVSDVRLTFTNAMTYNLPCDDVHIMADTMHKFFEKRWKPIGEKLAAADEVVKREAEAAKPVSLPKKRKAPPMDHSVIVPKSIKPKMTYDEKQNLRCRLTSLLEDLPNHIIDFLRQRSNNAMASEDEIEIDIQTLTDDTLFDLRKLLDDYFGGKQSAQQAKAEPCEMEILIESGLSNSSMHPCKGNEPADEDVDIGGDDPPVSSYPPVEIEKDTAPRSSKCSSSSSSSSDSGSSSCDSDSGSSSGSESDVKVATPAKAVKENGRSGAAMDQEKCDTTYSIDANRTVSALDQQEHGARPKPASVVADGRQEGENATSERQVSPDKLYRAALLRSRFADTILKAREKTLNQGEKKDPEKLRREKGQLERQQREEKARLQAEAKAAEDARRQAEAEAAAEAKRKRELEREAARQALLQMEKTVEIDENSLFLKDLEIVRTVPGDHIPSTVHEMSPDQSQEGMGGFKLGGSNPLEQLGLFMKADEEEEEEEEEEGGSTSVRVNDVEEGEIDYRVLCLL